MSKLDDVSWHIEAAGEPEETAEVRAGVHIGLFLAWAVARGHWQGLPGQEDAPVEKLRARSMTGTQFLLEECDGKLLAQMFTADLAPWARRFYDRTYGPLYDAVIRSAGLQEYHVPDTWQLFEALASGLDEAWVSERRRPWWRFW